METLTPVEPIVTEEEVKLDFASAKLKVEQAICRFTESITSERFTDPDEAFENFMPIRIGLTSEFLFNEQQLRIIRDYARQICSSDEIAKNILIQYKTHIVGEGLTLTIYPTESIDDPVKLSSITEDAKIKQMKKNWKAFCQVNEVTKKLDDWVTRDLRDGETFVRIFDSRKKYAGMRVPEIRFVDPFRIRRSDGDDPFGMVTEPEDLETVLSYTYYPGNEYGYTTLIQNKGGMLFLAPVKVPADQIIHTKRNVDGNVPRGLSRFYTVFNNIRRAAKNLVNLSVLCSILSAIAMIRKHEAPVSQDKLNRLTQKNSDGRQHVDPQSGKLKNAQYMSAGTVLDASKGIEYDFPSINVKTEEFIKAIDKELAQVALAFCLPVQWMMSTEPVKEVPINAGSPVTKNFAMEQRLLYGEEESPLVKLFWKVQMLMGMTEEDQLNYDIIFTGPALGVESTLDEARAEEIAIRTGASSPQNYAQKLGNKYVTQRSNMIKHRNTKQEGEVMPGDAGNTNVTDKQTSAGQGGDGITKKGGGSRVADGK